MRTVAVVLAGGSGLRFGGSTPKQLQLLAGRTLVEHCVAAFDAAPAVDEVLVVIGAEYVAAAAAELGRYDKVADVVAGGSARTDSTRQAIAAITAAMAADALSGTHTASTGTASADESGADPYDADLHDADLRDPGLRHADLHDADLRDAHLHDADLRDANVHDADLRDADLRDADLHDADRPGHTDPYGTGRPHRTARTSAGRAGRARRATAAGGTDCNVLFHDAARPLVTQEIIADCVAALDRWQAIGVVVPSSDTIVEVADGTLGRVLPRGSLARCQTPQGFRLSVIERAYRAAEADPGFAAMSATDDCGVVRRYLPDIQIGAVPGSERNMKITYPGDLAIAEALLRQPSGNGSNPE